MGSACVLSRELSSAVRSACETPSGCRLTAVTRRRLIDRGYGLSNAASNGRRLLIRRCCLRAHVRFHGQVQSIHAVSVRDFPGYVDPKIYTVSFRGRTLIEL